MDAGAGFNALAAAGAQAGLDKIQRKRNADDEERRQKASDLIGTRNGILTKLPTLLGANGEKTPEYDQAYQSLTQAQQDLGQLYHPDKAPGALAKDWHYLLERMHGITSPKDKSSSATTPPAAMTQSFPAAPLTTPKLPGYDQTTPVDQGGVTTSVPEVAATMGPGMAPAASMTLPAGPIVTKAPPVPWAQGQVQKLKDAAQQKAQSQAQLLASGVGPSPAQQAMTQYRADDAVQQAKIDATLKTAEKLGLSETAIDELKQQMVGLKNVTPKPLTGEAGKPYKGEDGLYYQSVSNPDGSIGRRSMNPDWKPNSKAMVGTILNTKKYGYIKTWVDPFNPSKIVGFQKITPGRQYTGSTSSSSATDAAGITTTSSRSTMPTNQAPIDMDLSSAQQVPDNFMGDELPDSSTPAGQAAPAPPPSGSPNKSPVPQAAPPKSVAKPVSGAAPVTPKTPKELKNQIPAPPQAAGKTPSLALDSNGHIPLNAPYNSQLIQAANQLLDGADISKLPLPAKDKEAAAEVASKYGWGGQGMFNPQQKLQIREASTFLNNAVSNPSMSVLDSLLSRKKLIARLNNSEGHAGILEKQVAEDFKLNPKEEEFLRMYRQLVGTISGLASLTRPGRPTESGIKRLMSELPDPHESYSASDGKKRLERLIQEIKIAQQKGNADELLGSGSPSTASRPGQITSDQIMDMYMKHKNSSPPK